MLPQLSCNKAPLALTRFQWPTHSLRNVFISYFKEYSKAFIKSKLSIFSMPSNDYSNVIFFCREEGFTPSFTVKVYRFFYFTEDIFLCCLLYSNGWLVCRPGSTRVSCGTRRTRSSRPTPILTGRQRLYGTLSDSGKDWPGMSLEKSRILILPSGNNRSRSDPRNKTVSGNYLIFST